MSQKEFQGVKVIENAASGRLSAREAFRLLQLDEELRTPRLLGMEVTKTWIGAPHHPSARGLARRDFLDCRPQLIVRECSGVVHCDLAGAIEQH